MAEYHGKLRRWMPAIRRWRQAGLSWPSIGRLLYEMKVWSAPRYRNDRAAAERSLTISAFLAHKQMTRSAPTTGAELATAKREAKRLNDLVAELIRRYR